MTSPWRIAGIDALVSELHALDGNETLTMGQIKDVINAEFGTDFTRNAIIGRCHRLKLPKRPSPLPPKPVKREKIEMPEQAPMPIKPEIIAPQPLRNGISIYELDNSTCHFVLDDLESRPPFTYCGKQTRDGGGSWCEEHHGRVYAKGGKW